MSDNNRTIYLDNSATTKICPEALEVYNRVSTEHFGNPSSLHKEGFEAEALLKESRATILQTLGAKDSSIIFTSSGTESNNLAITGRAFAKERFIGKGKLITTKGEHASVSEPMERLRKLGYKICYVDTKDGQLDFSQLEKELDDSVVLVSIMLVNNETGAVYDVPRVAKALAKYAKNAYLHVDATQGYMKIPFIKGVLGADLITISSHKIEGPKGIGALIIDQRVIKEKGLSPIILGGGQEDNFRSGTENVPAICAFAKAAQVYSDNLKERVQKITELREYLIEKIISDVELSEISITNPKMHSPHILNITLPNIKSETMLHFLSTEGIFVSSGSACSSNTSHHVSGALTAYGRSEREADCSIRISFSHRNKKEDADSLCEALKRGLKKLTRMK